MSIIDYSPHQCLQHNTHRSRWKY